jgi:uncharacterized protein YbbC (DUF1343 family)
MHKGHKGTLYFMEQNISKMSIILLLSALFLNACRERSVQSEQIKTGCEQTTLYLSLLKGKSVALVANNTSRIGKSHLADSLINSGINLVRIFSPEHGFRGDADAGAALGNITDDRTGVPVISLYGSKTKPTPDDLKGIDIMVYDIQDVGVRFYTYISTLQYVMEACAASNIPVLILDRPDPLGFYIDGPVLDTVYKSFVGLIPIPVVYGMTVGELARMINGEGWLSDNLKCDLKVIPCSNYDHNTCYNLPVNPSPNLNSMEAVYLYPSVCFFEGTIMSLGRGTAFPFRVVGHPDYPMKSFSFTPLANTANQSPKYMNKTCYGINLQPMDIVSLRQMHELNLQWLIDLYKTMDRGDAFFTDYINKLAGTGELRKQILAGYTEDQIRQSWQDDLEKFRVLRKKYLMYKDFAK